MTLKLPSLPISPLRNLHLDSPWSKKSTLAPCSVQRQHGLLSDAQPALDDPESEDEVKSSLMAAMETEDIPHTTMLSPDSSPYHDSPIGPPSHSGDEEEE